MSEPIVKDLGDGALIIQTRAAWEASTAYVLDDVVRPTNGAFTGYEYVCSRAGTSGTAEPAWPTTLAATVDDPNAQGAGWTCQAIAQGAEIAFVNEGSVQWTEPNADKMHFDRGVPDHRRRALPLEIMSVSIGALYTRLKHDAGDSADSLYELLTRTGDAAAYNSQSGAGEPYSVHLALKIYDEPLTKYEVLEFPEFKENQIQVTEGAEADEISIEGTSFRSGSTTQRPYISHL